MNGAGATMNAPVRASLIAQCLLQTPIDPIHASSTMDAYVLPPPEHRYPLCLPEKAMDFVGQVGDNWRSGGTSSASANRRGGRRPTRRLSNFDALKGGTTRTRRIRLSLADGSDRSVEGFDIDPSANLRTVLREYAERRGVSLRSLRFSYNGRALFLSSVGNKSPNQLNMRDRDVIVVHDTSVIEETSVSRSRKPDKNVQQKKSGSPKRAAKGKRKKKRTQVKYEEPSTSLEECKAEHSKRLSKIHEEVDHLLKEIRTRLNSLSLERQPPKRKRSKEKKSARVRADLSGLPTPGVEGGKAGRSRFLVHVGEVQNLYKTAKPSSGRGPCDASSTLDLHGHTREEALAKLDESLEVWVDTAMRGSYPFVVSAKIVCGCGNQIIAETVEKWIKSTRNVGNAPGHIH